MEIARNLKVESVQRLAPVAPLRLDPTDTVGEAVALMRRQGTGCVLVVGADGKLVGIFTERDLLRRVLVPGLPMTTRLRDVMTRDVVTTAPGEAIAQAIGRMQGGAFRHLPVISESGVPLGVLSVKRVVHYLVEHFPATICCLPPNPNEYPSEREGA